MQDRGAEVTLVLGPTALAVPRGIKVVNVLSAGEMFKACEAVFPQCDIAVLNAAVADYTVKEVAAEKIKKTEGEFTLNLAPTRDILKSLGSMKKKNQLLVGFALETTHEKENALKKLGSKNADMIVLNSLRDAGAGFDHDTNKITIFDKSGGHQEYELKTKKEVAVDIVNAVIKMFYAKD
jgi:phosphopantothenoylcysteine decarboxylase/phosphopantothenate--cysteine ligase